MLRLVSKSTNTVLYTTSLHGLHVVFQSGQTYLKKDAVQIYSTLNLLRLFSQRVENRLEVDFAMLLLSESHWHIGRHVTNTHSKLHHWNGTPSRSCWKSLYLLGVTSRLLSKFQMGSQGFSAELFSSSELISRANFCAQKSNFRPPLWFFFHF